MIYTYIAHGRYCEGEYQAVRVTWLKSLRAPLKRVLALRTFPERFRMTATWQGRHSDTVMMEAMEAMEAGEVRHAIKSPSVWWPLWKLRVIVRIGEERDTRRIAIYFRARIRVSGTPRKPRGDDSRGNFHFIIPPGSPPVPPSRSFLSHHRALPALLCTTTSETTCTDS